MNTPQIPSEESFHKVFNIVRFRISLEKGNKAEAEIAPLVKKTEEHFGIAPMFDQVFPFLVHLIHEKYPDSHTAQDAINLFIYNAANTIGEGNVRYEVDFHKKQTPDQTQAIIREQERVEDAMYELLAQTGH